MNVILKSLVKWGWMLRITPPNSEIISIKMNNFTSSWENYENYSKNFGEYIWNFFFKATKNRIIYFDVILK